MGSSRGAWSGPDAPATTTPAPTVSLDEVWAGARRRLLAAVIALPGGVGLAVLAAWAATRPLAGAEWDLLAVGGVVLEVAVVVPRALRVWRLWRARRRDGEVQGEPHPVRLAVQASGPLAALPAVVAVWRADAPNDPPVRVDAVDRSALPLVDGGRMWATVVGGLHRLATYRLEDGTPIIAAGRTNLRQRWYARAEARDRRRVGGLDRRPDAPYPAVRVDGDLVTELRAVAVPMATLALLVAGVGLLAIVPSLSAGLGVDPGVAGAALSAPAASPRPRRRAGGCARTWRRRGSRRHPRRRGRPRPWRPAGR